MRQGADIIGIADLKLLEGIFTHPKNLLERYRYGISVAVSLEQHNGYDNTTEDKAFACLEKIALNIEKYLQRQVTMAKLFPAIKGLEEMAHCSGKARFHIKRLQKQQV